VTSLITLLTESSIRHGAGAVVVSPSLPQPHLMVGVGGFIPHPPHCSVKINDIPVPSEGLNSMIYPLAADWAYGRRDLCRLTRLPVHVGPL